MLFTHEGRFTTTFEHPNTKGRLEQVLGNWEESDGVRRLDGPAVEIVREALVVFGLLCHMMSSEMTQSLPSVNALSSRMESPPTA